MGLHQLIEFEDVLSVVEVLDDVLALTGDLVRVYRPFIGSNPFRSSALTWIISPDEPQGYHGPQNLLCVFPRDVRRVLYSGWLLGSLLNYPENL